MFFFRRPTAQRIDRFRQMATRETFSYPEVGATLKGEIPERYNLDHNRVRLGEGAVTFERASAALCEWKMFDIGWVELLHPRGPAGAGQTVLVLARTCGLYSLSASRVIGMIEDESGHVRRRGFSYGTLQHHVERGEERFSIEHDLKDDSVWYDILAFSVPQHPFARIAHPLSRAAQRRFAGDSKAAMLRAIF
ncbi:MAG TPA: DUF1990 domain-containing protein [Acidobacteriaceae bacterium]|jgi:uncharacterized protein (UPF0548 family)|nr:DUF1990 domain-containing protein [Acidobacteriaceae bacterium]